MARPTIIEKIFTILPKHLDANGEFDAESIFKNQDFKGVTFDFEMRPLLKKIKGKFPNSIKKLYLDNCLNLKSLNAESLPANLEELNLSFSGIEKITGKLPNSIKKLNLDFCKNLKYLNVEILPANLEELDLSCSGIEKITGKLPNSIKKLNLFGCKNLKSLNAENLPNNLEKLDLLHCDKLEYNENLLLKLRELEGRGCVVHYPRHFLNKDQALVTNKLNKAIEKAKEIDRNFEAEKTKKIITNFLQEGVDQRGGMAAIISELSPILEFIEKNPESLFWIEETMESVPGCVNQPVAMILEVTSWIELASQKTLPEKVEASKRLLTQNILKEYVLKFEKKGEKLYSTDPTLIGGGVLIEAQNALFREVHKMMLTNKDITQEWLGVPKSLFAEGTITSWLEQPNIVENAYNLVKTGALEADSNKLKELLSSQKAWQLIAFPKETKEEEKLLRAEFGILEAVVKFKENFAETKKLSIDEQKQKFAVAIEKLANTIRETKKDLNEEQKVKLDEFYNIIKAEDRKILNKKLIDFNDYIEQKLVEFITPKTMEIKPLEQVYFIPETKVEMPKFSGLSKEQDGNILY